MDFSNMAGGRVQLLQAQLFPTCTLTPATLGGKGFLGNFLAKTLKTNQLEVNTDEKTHRPIARLKEPRDLFALPKDKEYDCPQQAPRWPIECQVIAERVVHLNTVPAEPEPYNQPTGSELKPRPVGEENGIVVFNYYPISAVNYSEPKKKTKATNSSSDSDISSSESRPSTPDCSTPDRRKLKMKDSFSRLLAKLEPRSSSNSNDDLDDDDDDDDDDDLAVVAGNKPTNKKASLKRKPKQQAKQQQQQHDKDIDVDDIWDCNFPGYLASSTSQPSKTTKETGIVEPQPKSSSVRKKQKADMKAIYQYPVSPAKLSDSDSSLLSKTSNSESATSTQFRDRLKGGQDVPPPDDDGGAYVDGDGVTALHKNSKDSKSSTWPRSGMTKHWYEELEEIRKMTAARKMQMKKSNNSTTSTTTTTMTNVDKNDKNDSDNARDNDSLQFIEPQFSRSAVGGAKMLTNCHPYNPDEYDGLEFESRFESGNLAKAVMITKSYYELYLRPDLYTSRSKQWFYFRVKNTRKNIIYRFSIVNLVKSDSLYNDGMRPLMYSTINAKNHQEGWMRCGTNICYYRNDDESSTDDEEDTSSYSLTFNVEFPNDNDTVYFAHSYPYTYSDLQDYLMAIQKDPVKSKFCKLRLLCRSLAGNNVYYLTVTSPTTNESGLKKKKAIIVSARVHPSETPSSWMMKGLMDFITADTAVAKRLRHRYIFKLIPMLNPDGVIVGNTRNSLTGKDLNRQYRTVIRETYPSIWYTKAMIKRLIDESNVVLYCDMHAHSRKHNIFVYGCENKRNPEKKLTEQVFPLMLHKNVADKFSFESCKFKVQRSKEGTGRIVVWMLGITNSYTIEASFGGSSLGSRKGTLFNTADYEHMGRVFCETLLDFGDETPNKECLRLKIIERLLKEGSSADEPLNIPLSDYSSDEGNSGANSDNEENFSLCLSDLEGPCCASLRAPPTSPEVTIEIRKRKYRRMRKIMVELDRIYFQPLFQRRFNLMMRIKRLKKKKAIAEKKKDQKKGSSWRLTGGAEGTSETQKTSNSSLRNTQDDTTENSGSKSNNGSEEQSTDPLDMMNLTYKKISRKRKKKAKQTENNEPKTRLRISRKLRLWLAKRQIHIFRSQKTRRIRTRTKLFYKKKYEVQQQRVAIDMPTTDPGSELIFSTDDEYYFQPSYEVDPRQRRYHTVPRAKTRNFLMQSALQRRYIEEIGDGAMPPELHVTPQYAKVTFRQTVKSNTPSAQQQQQRHQREPIKTRKEPAFEFPRLSYKPSSLKIRSQKVPKPMHHHKSQTDLERRLSLRSRIWLNHANRSSNTSAEPQPQLNPTPWSAKTFFPARLVNKNPPDNSDREQRRQMRRDPEMVLTACSQKLQMWQLEEQRNSGGGMPPLKSPRKAVQPLNYNLMIPEANEEERTLRILRGVKPIDQSEPSEGVGRFRQYNPIVLSKLPDTMKILTRLTNARSKTRANVTLSNTQRPSRTSIRARPSTGPNKFKTSGIVVTAVQTSKRSRTSDGSNSKLAKEFRHKSPPNEKSSNSGGGGKSKSRSNSQKSLKSAAKSKSPVNKGKSAAKKKTPSNSSTITTTTATATTQKKADQRARRLTAGASNTSAAEGRLAVGGGDVRIGGVGGTPKILIRKIMSS